jgi:hypothetical protein
MHEYDIQITAELTEAHFLAWIEGKIEQLYQEAKAMVNASSFAIKVSPTAISFAIILSPKQR